MGIQQKLNAFLFQVSIVFLIFLLVSASHEHKKAKGRHSSKKDHHIKMSSRLQFEITLHGFLLWASMAFLMPVGILVIRLSNREGNRRRLRIIFYAHAVLQKLAVLLATAGAIMSIKNFNNSFDNNHQRLGVALYGIIWLQVLVGIFRPQSIQLFSCSSQGIQKKKSMVLCTLGNGNFSVITGCLECIYWFTILPRKNIKEHKNLEYTFHCSDIFDCYLLPSSRKMGLHTKPRSDLGQLSTNY
uniref:Cytochrome b561 domain-containing protein n=1 Tax=Cajanus cajan TaxID=3821 RepID=A0A151U212_CAJCA|nr:hypothetical protein KK1_005955 [Cajanus cajan]